MEHIYSTAICSIISEFKQQIITFLNIVNNLEQAATPIPYKLVLHHIWRDFTRLKLDISNLLSTREDSSLDLNVFRGIEP
jgi:hypothetical protein